MLVVQLLILLAAPYLLTKLTLKLGTQDLLSPVVLCYLLGILLRNLTAFPLSDSLSMSVSQATILLAIPLLLYSTDIKGWFRLAPKTILAFVLIIMSVLVSTTLANLYYKDLLPDSNLLSGMLAAVYIGGTPNMNAVGMAMEVPESTFITLNAAEMVCGGTWLIFLTTLAPRFFGLFLKPFEYPHEEDEKEFYPVNGYGVKDVLKALGLTLVLAGLTAGLVYLIFGTLEKPGWLILTLSAFAIAASMWQEVRNLNGAFQSGEYLLLIFCVAIGMMADIGEILTSGGTHIAFAASVLLLSVFFHVILCRLFNIDRDTMVITSTAGFYGPPFIGQIAAVLHNRSIVVSGIITSLVGLAVANFLGVALAELLGSW
ncbi:MAG: hypothetical protein CMN32_16800 [Saprospirales bacterium]|nr:hypothetical protein [Saprospirales bacterium]